MSEDHRVAVAVIHGMGSQGDKPQQDYEISFSRDLYKGLRRRIGEDRFDNLVGWREIFWSHILQERQQDYINKSLKSEARWLETRGFVMHRLADAAAYRWEKGDHSFVYPAIHERVSRALAHLEDLRPAVVRRSSCWRIHWAGMSCPITSGIFRTRSEERRVG